MPARVYAYTVLSGDATSIVCIVTIDPSAGARILPAAIRRWQID